MNNPIASAIKQVCDEKDIPQEYVVEALEHALAAAYRKDFGEKDQNIKVEFDIITGGQRVFDVKTVVEDYTEEEIEAQAEMEPEEFEQEGVKKRYNPKTDIMISEAKLKKEDAMLGDEIKTELPLSEEFGRMAAQTAKQVIIQKLREAERDLVFEDFKDKEHTIVMATVQRRDGARVLMDIGRGTAILPMDEQSRRERYNTGERYKVYILSVEKGLRGPEIIVSRSHPDMVKQIFEFEIPEIEDGVIEIKGIAREAGDRAKVAVWTEQENIDPIGSCIGQRGSRIQTIISELGGEKVDIIQYDEDPEQYIMNALSPAKVDTIELDEETKVAKVHVKDDQLSLAIGKGGQNVRLASQLTGWNIQIVSEGGENPDGETAEEGEVSDTGEQEPVSEEGQEAQESQAESEETTAKEEVVEETESKEGQEEVDTDEEENKEEDKKGE